MFWRRRCPSLHHLTALNPDPMKQNKTGPFIKEDHPQREIFAFVANYKKLWQYRMQCFNPLGGVTVVDKENGKEEYKDGRKFILENLAFFESLDEAYYYRICAKLKSVLDEYDWKFKPK